MRSITGEAPPSYAALLRESAARYVMAFQRDEGFQRYQAKTEFWAALRRYRLRCQAEAELIIEREASTTH